VTLAPKEWVELVEAWELFGGVPDCPKEAAIDAIVLPRVGK
jgi:hypothetical protein